MLQLLSQKPDKYSSFTQISCLQDSSNISFLPGLCVYLCFWHPDKHFRFSPSWYVSCPTKLKFLYLAIPIRVNSYFMAVVYHSTLSLSMLHVLSITATSVHLFLSGSLISYLPLCEMHVLPIIPTIIHLHFLTLGYSGISPPCVLHGLSIPSTVLHLRFLAVVCCGTSTSPPALPSSSSLSSLIFNSSATPDVAASNSRCVCARF